MSRPIFYRVRTRARRTNLTAMFSDFGDANRWAMGYCKGSPRKASATVVGTDGIERVTYRTVGDGRVRMGEGPA